MSGGIFLTVKDLMLLKGTDNYRSACREHLNIRLSLAKSAKKHNRKRFLKRHLTIEEYCRFEDIPLDEVMKRLRGKQEGEE